MITVTGNTFTHRELLKQLGGQWDKSFGWSLDHLSDANIAVLRSKVGVFVNVASQMQQDDDDEPEPVRMRVGPTEVNGDDERFLNHFADQNPTAFFGFSSLNAFVDYIEKLREPRSDDRNDGWKTSDHKWRGTPSMPAALRLVRDGWHEGAERAAELEIPHAVARKRLYGVAGGTVSVGRLLAGNPAHMRRRPKQSGRKVITLFVETFMSAAIDPENAITRAILIAHIADTMEREGYSCEIVAVVTTLGGYNRVGHQAAITLKQAGEQLNILDVVFALGHPSFFRRLIFAAVGASEACESTWQTQGMPTAAFNANHPCAKNEFYIKQLSMGDQQRLNDDDPFDMLRFIEPDGLPIKVKNDEHT